MEKAPLLQFCDTDPPTHGGPALYSMFCLREVENGCAEHAFPALYTHRHRCSRQHLGNILTASRAERTTASKWFKSDALSLHNFVTTMSLVRADMARCSYTCKPNCGVQELRLTASRYMSYSTFKLCKRRGVTRLGGSVVREIV